MQFQWVLVCVVLLASVFQVCFSANLTAYKACTNRFKCGDKSYSYPFWGGTRPYYCGVRDFQLVCQDNLTFIQISGDIYRVLNILEANQTMTIVRSDVQGLDYGSYCPIISKDPEVGDYRFFSGLESELKYAPGTQNLTLFYNCSSDMTYEFEGITCYSGSWINVYFRDRPEYKDYSHNNSKCQGSMYIPVRPFPVHSYLYQVASEGFDVNIAVTYRSLCANCTKSGGVCGSTKSYDNNFRCYCNDGTSLRNICSPPPPGKSSILGRQIALVAGSIFGFCILLVIILCISFRYKFSSANFFLFEKRSKKTEMVEDFLRNNGPIALKRYNYSDVKKMTDSFKNKLGQGGFGSVFKGKLVDGRLVAVKVMSESKGNGEDFINEVASISRTSHVNVVSLIGFCSNRSKRAIIYEFMPNGSLEKFIYKDKPLETSPTLPWQKLYEIVVGVSRGLEYLHRGCNTRIVHFDIKPHNILLDEDFIPKISDFGLAKLCSKKENHVSMLIARGTVGYIAPEVFDRNVGAVSYKSDVYSYGMMVLEIVGGRKNINAFADHTSEIFFPHWIHTRIEFNDDLGLNEISSDADAEVTKKMILVGLWCIQRNPSDRPSMSKVVEMLEGSLNSLQLPPKVILSSSSGTQQAFSTTVESQSREDSPEIKVE